jgi:large subunit ribosomal protein L1
LFRANGIRGTLKLPVSTNSNVILLVFTNTARQELASKAGAHIVGGEELVTPIMEGKLEFNRCLATTDMLNTVMKLARYLGPKGLMPNSKNGSALICYRFVLGTLTNDLVPTIKESLNNIPFRIERHAGLANIPVARLEFEPLQIKANVVAVVEKILSLSTVKKRPSDFITAMQLSMHGHPGVLIKRSEYEQLQGVGLKSNYKIPVKPLFSMKPFKPRKDTPLVTDIVYG